MKSAERKDEAYAVLCECKNLGRLIKSHRQPVLSTSVIGTTLVAAAVATPLLEIYFSTFELAHRILHIPSFRREYGRFLGDPSSVSQATKIQLQLCLAIGASMRDETFELRRTAIQWVYEARLWLIMPSEKDRISVTGVQVMCLLQVARQAVGVAPGVAWPDAGSLMRSAMFAGMHRDPARLPAMSVLRAEVRRRLWATILEMALQTCVETGAPPLVSLDDFDTLPPRDLDDDELTDEPETAARRRDPAAPGEDRHTQTSLQLLLHSHLAVRLAVAKFANDVASTSSYEEALRLHDRVTAACHQVSRRVAHLVQNTAGSSAPITVFHQRYVEHITRRFVLALHYPFLPHFTEPAYCFSRKVLTDVARRLAPLHLLRPEEAEAGAAPGAGHWRNLSICSIGFARTALQAFILLGPELVALKREEIESYGEPGSGGAELRALLEGGMEWQLARIRAGETNVKGYMIMDAILAEVDGMVAGLEGDAMEEHVLGRMKGMLEKALETLKDMARSAGIGAEAAGNPIDLDTPPEFQEGFGLGDPFDTVGWQLDWEDMTNLTGLLT